MSRKDKVCEKCGHKLREYEYYVELKDRKILCESCFFDIALNELKAKSRQNGHMMFEIE